MQKESFFKIFMEYLSTVFLEQKFIFKAISVHNVKLPKRYWRFAVLRPLFFWKTVDHITEIDSPLVRNFCPLFWVTNILLLVYLFIGWLFLLIYIVVRLVVGALRSFDQYLIKSKIRKMKDREISAEKYRESFIKDFSFCNAPRILDGMLGLQHHASLIYGNDDEIMNFKDSSKIETYLTEWGDDEEYLFYNFFKAFPETYEKELEKLLARHKLAEEEKLAYEEAQKKAKELRGARIAAWLKQINSSLSFIILLSKWVFKIIIACVAIEGVILLWKIAKWCWPGIVAAFNWSYNSIVDTLTWIIHVNWLWWAGTLFYEITAFIAMIIASYVLYRVVIWILELPFIDAIIEKLYITLADRNINDDGNYEGYKECRRKKIEEEHTSNTARFIVVVWGIIFDFLCECAEHFGNFIAKYIWGIIKFPFIFFAMFYSKNCPHIEIEDKE